MSNRLELYGKSVNKLFDAYFNDTLQHGNCKACAVGNIVGGSQWGFLFFTDNKKRQKSASENRVLAMGCDILCEDGYLIDLRNGALKEIEDSGYLKEELMRIEHGFETAEEGSSEEDYMFNGLVAVLDILKEIHEISDDSEEVKRFTNEHNRKLELVS